VCLYLSNGVGDGQIHIKENSPFFRITSKGIKVGDDLICGFCLDIFNFILIFLNYNLTTINI
jgi:hypothetical protein